MAIFNSGKTIVKQATTAKRHNVVTPANLIPTAGHVELLTLAARADKAAKRAIRRTTKSVTLAEKISLTPPELLK